MTAKLYIALFRGINVGGKALLPMKKLAALLEALGAREVRTYIQSGNAVFTSGEEASRLAEAIARGIEQDFGFAPLLQLWTLEDFERAIEANPFPEATAEASTLHLGFLAQAPRQPDLAALEALREGREEYRLLDRVFYLKAPEGIGRSRLAARSEKILGVSLTDRNWRTVCALRDLARG